MRRLLFVALLAACETTRTPITRPIVTLGYDRPPSVVVVARGDADAVERWAASLRTEKTVAIVGELQAETVEPVSSEAKFLCGTVRRAFPDQHVDEIIVLDVEKASAPNETCIRSVCTSRGFLPKNDNPPSCYCVRREYRAVTTSYKTTVSAIRASSCLVVASEELPAVTGESKAHPPIAFGSDSEVAAIQETDRADSSTAAAAALARTVEAHRWQLFPAFDATVRAVDKQTVEVVDELERLEARRTYWIRRPDGALGSTAYVSKVDAATATVSTTGRPIEARDELHETTEVRRVMMYGGLSGGTIRADDGRHGTAAAALACRVSFKVMPMMFEVRLDGDLVPGLDTARWAASGAGGFRYQLGPIAPLAFAELGLAKAYQPDATTAFGFQAGVGAGAEVSLGRWVLLLDVRYRRFYVDDWEKDGMTVEATSPYDSWRSTTLHLGAGALF